MFQAALQKERLANQAALDKERLASQVALHAALEKERLASHAALEAPLVKERLASQVALDERDQATTRLIEEERSRNEAGQRALYELFVVSFFHISQIMCVMSVSLLTNTTHSSGSVREERSSPSADDRLLFDWHGEFHYKLVLIIECHRANSDIAKYLSTE